MTTFLLIRHAAHDLLGRTLAGRTPGVHLNARGKAEAEQMVSRLRDVPARALVSSPMERCRETAQPLAGSFGLPILIHDGASEVNTGAWTGMDFSELESDPEWHQWNAERATARCPDGESMLEVQDRIISTLRDLREAHDRECVAIISHGDVIKAALMHFLRIPFTGIHGFEISPASVSIVRLSDSHSQVVSMNDIGSIPVQLGC